MPFEHNLMSLDTFFVALPLGKILFFLLYFFQSTQCQQRYLPDYCLGYNKLCFTRDVRIFIHNKAKTAVT